MLTRIILIICVATAGCTLQRSSDGAESLSVASATAAITQSGSRIRATVLTTPDGAVIFTGYHDMDRGEDCQFGLPASDGVVRCLPLASALPASPYFSDAGCTVPTLRTIYYSCAQPPVYLYTTPATSETCPLVQHYGSFYAAIQISDPFYIKSGISCFKITIAAGQVVYGPSGAEIPPTAFQSASPGID